MPPSLSSPTLVPSACLFLSSPPSISYSMLSSFIRPTGLLKPAWQGQSLHVFICIRGVETDEYSGTDRLFLLWAQQTLMQWKGFLNRIVYVPVWEKRRQAQRYSLFNFIFFCPDPLIRICMTLRARVVYCTDNYWYKQQYSCCCSPSLFCRQTAGNPQKLKALNPTTQTLKNMLCCASRSLHSPDWRRFMHLCYRIGATPHGCYSSLVFLFSRHCTPLAFSQNSTVHNKDRTCYHEVVKNFKVSVVK